MISCFHNSTLWNLYFFFCIRGVKLICLLSLKIVRYFNLRLKYISIFLGFFISPGPVFMVEFLHISIYHNISIHFRFKCAEQNISLYNTSRNLWPHAFTKYIVLRIDSFLELIGKITFDPYLTPYLKLLVEGNSTGL